MMKLFHDIAQIAPIYRGAFCQFTFWWIYSCHSSKSTGKETGKTHLCAMSSDHEMLTDYPDSTLNKN